MRRWFNLFFKDKEVKLGLCMNGGRDHFWVKLHNSNLIKIKCTKCCRTVCYRLFNRMYYQKEFKKLEQHQHSWWVKMYWKPFNTAEKMMYFSAKVSEYFTQVISCGAYDEQWSFAALLCIKKCLREPATNQKTVNDMFFFSFLLQHCHRFAEVFFF